MRVIVGDTGAARQLSMLMLQCIFAVSAWFMVKDPLHVAIIGKHGINHVLQFISAKLYSELKMR